MKSRTHCQRRRMRLPLPLLALCLFALVASAAIAREAVHDASASEHGVVGIAPRLLALQFHLACVVKPKPPEVQRRPGDVAAQLLPPFAVVCASLHGRHPDRRGRFAPSPQSARPAAVPG